MNEEELKKGCEKKYLHSQGYSICGEHFGDGSISLCPYCKGKLEGFQKGKLEQKKEELEWLEDFMRGFKVDKNGFTDGFNTRFTDERIKQLQKEIGGMK